MKNLWLKRSIINSKYLQNVDVLLKTSMFGVAEIFTNVSMLIS